MRRALLVPILLAACQSTPAARPKVHVATLTSPSPASKAVAIMQDRKTPFNVLPVIDRRRRAVGMVQIHDLRARGL